ncbi:type II toxin-antitoxin system HipA family toxin YjjJ [Endothiovibrio diazotrophicus]
MDPSLERLFRTAAGPLTQPEIRAALGVSQPTVSRLLRGAAERVMRFGRGRATRYALTVERPVGVGRIPLYAVDANGVPEEIALLRPLAGDGFGVAVEGAPPAWLAGESGVGLFDGLPYFADDARPQGFLGRAIAQHLGAPYPPDPTAWSGDTVLRYLLEWGEDLPGNLLFGERAVERYDAARGQLVLHRRADYPQLAERELAGGAVGSSAGGEQPKFAVDCAERGPVIVKFSPPAGDAVADRWRDLLVAEQLALATLREAGVATAESELLEIGGRLFLESVRFDRTPRGGRLPALSLAAVDAEFVGDGRRWPAVTAALLRAGRLAPEAHRQVVRARAFGEWIANGDMHLGNLSLAPQGDGFRLLPLYDMLPMHFAPARAEVVPRDYRPPPRRRDIAEAWRPMGEVALRYWGRVAADGRIGDGFRHIAEQARQVIDEALSAE